MGFFSWNCRGCGHPLLSAYVTTPINKWMLEGVAVTAKGNLIIGGYDGYGRLDGLEINGDVRWKKDGSAVYEPDVYHQACWELLGTPKKYKGGSESARDQGYFFSKGAHDVLKPTTMAMLTSIGIASHIRVRQQAAADRKQERQWTKERETELLGKLEATVKKVKRVLKRIEGRKTNGKNKTNRR